MPDSNRLQGRLVWISRQLGMLVGVASAVCVLAHVAGPPQADAVLPSVTTLLAILFCACACACACALSFPPQRTHGVTFRQSLARTGFVVGALTLITGSLLAWWLWGWPRTTAGQVWGIAPNTAFVLLLVAIAILCLQATRTVAVAQGLAILAVTLCLLALLGYIEGAFPLASLGTAFPITIPSALLMAGISLAVLYARPDLGPMAIMTSRTLAGTVARRLLLPLVLLPVLMNFLLHRVAAIGWYAPGLENGLFTFATMLTIAALVWWQVLTLYGEQSRRQHLQDQTQQSEQRYAELVQAVTDYAIYTLDAEGRINSWNAGAEKIRGYTAEEILGQPYAGLFPPESVTAGVPRQMLEIARREGRVVDEGWQVRKDGSRFYAHSILTSVKDAQGQLLGFAKVTRNITTQKRAEAEQIKLQSLLNTVVDPILVIDQHGIVETFNPAAERVFGYRADEVLQRNVSLLMTAPDREQHDQYLRRFLETRDPHVIGIGREIEARRKDGSVFPAELTVSEMSVDGRCMFTGIVRDITTRKATEESIKRSEERLSLALEAGHIGVWDMDVASESILVTGDLFAMLDVPDGAESLFSTWARLNHPDDQSLILEQFEQVARGQRNGMELEHRLPMKNGAWRWLFSCARVSRRDSENRALTLHGVTVDVHERKTTEDDLRKSKLDMDLAMKAAAFHLWHFHCRERRLLDLELLVESLGYTTGPQTLEVSFWQSLLHPDDLAHWRNRKLLPLPVELGEGNDGVEIRLRARDGHWLWMSVRARVLETDRQGAPVIVAGTCLDITASKHAAQQLLHAAQHDALTGLPNRALTYAFGERILEATPRHGGRCAVLFIDLDHFKPINDHYGHAAGDLVLCEVARRLQRCVRGEDVVGRLGGDEFVVILAHVQKVEDITHIAADCLAAVGSPIAYRDLELQVSSSIGISLYPADGPDVSTLVKHADTAMYHAKQQGRDNFQFFTHAMNARAKSLLKLEGRMRRALEQEEFSLYYQPVVDTHTHRIIAAEALLRWPAADLAPADFIPLAESSGLIHALGDWVFLQACRQQKVWAQEGLADVSVAINVSPLQFRQPQFAARVANMVAEAGIAATSLQLEITENAFLRDLDEVVQTLNALRALGLRITLDDFGKGYSILNHLKMLPMDAVKVDKDFVYELQLDRKNLAITEAIITLGESLDLQVIAEGIETEAVLQLLRSKRCRHMQGFCLSHPLPAAEFASWVRDPLALERAYEH